MKLMKRIGQWSVILFVIFGSCSKNEPGPCAGKKKFKADFLLQENIADSLISSNVFLINSWVTFTALTDDRCLTGECSYEWKVGEDTTTFRKKQFSLQLYQDNVYPGLKIDVRLILRRPPDTLCFPDEAPIDTVYKSFEVVAQKDSPLIGKYQGYFGSDKIKSDKQIVEIGWSPDFPGRIYVTNINKGCNYKYIALCQLFAGARSAYLEQTGYADYNCNSPEAHLFLTGNDSLSCKFSYGVLENGVTTKRLNDSFFGIRIK
jgi:hypothetical protein